MLTVDFLVVGAGVTGLSFANAIRAEFERGALPRPSVLVLEAENEVGGYCRSIKRSGFVWDYSGHFFHFRNSEIERWLRERMSSEVRTILRKSNIWHRGTSIDFPFQKNIHQLPKEDFIDCLVTLFFRDSGSGPPRSFKDMIVRNFGTGIAERFLIPYNEKLYACDLDSLEAAAMGRFFPQASLSEIIRNMREPEDRTYNSTFTYPAGGAIEYIHALLRDLPADMVVCGEPVVSIDLQARVATTPKRRIRYGALVSSAPLPRLLQIAQMRHGDVFDWSKVVVFNLGFDRKGPRDVHWSYFPDREICFYRVGFYDNLMEADRMSLYVEIAAERDQPIDVEALRQRVLSELESVGIVAGHRLVDWHSVTLDPGYVHVSSGAVLEAAQVRPLLAESGVHSIGRYGAWTYCSIEDNIVAARALASALGPKGS